jgi:succinyldiaminopimelate transaminase
VRPSLPEFLWDRLDPYRRTATAYPDGLVDLSIGSPIDPVPSFIRDALADASDAPGYPTVRGTSQLREAAAAWMHRRLGVSVSADAVLPTIGSKELIAWLPTLLGLGADDLVVVPELAYPTYDIGGRLAGATVLATDSLVAIGPRSVALVWLNSPSNPTGKVLGIDHLRKVVSWARERGTVVASDECYIELGWTERPYSILHPDVCVGDATGLLAVHSLSKRSNLAGYRAGFVAGDQRLIDELVASRKHIGMMVPTPVQAAMAAALNDDQHLEHQRAIYLRRRDRLMEALPSSGFTIDASSGGLYLWATRGEPCWTTVDWFADRGVLVAPGDFYGPAGSQHVRIALTAADEQIAAAASRLGK